MSKGDLEKDNVKGYVDISRKTNREMCKTR